MPSTSKNRPPGPVPPRTPKSISRTCSASVACPSAPSRRSPSITSRLIQTRLRELFEARDEDRPPYTEAEVSRALTARGHKITTEGISNLLRSARITPKATTRRRPRRVLQRSRRLPPRRRRTRNDQPTGTSHGQILRRTHPQDEEKLVRVIHEFLQAEKVTRDSANDVAPPYLVN